MTHTMKNIFIIFLSVRLMKGAVSIFATLMSILLNEVSINGSGSPASYRTIPLSAASLYSLSHSSSRSVPLDSLKRLAVPISTPGTSLYGQQSMFMMMSEFITMLFSGFLYTPVIVNVFQNGSSSSSLSANVSVCPTACSRGYKLRANLSDMTTDFSSVQSFDASPATRSYPMNSKKLPLTYIGFTE